MYCINCGKEVDDNTTSCPYCGKIIDRGPIAEYDPYAEDIEATEETFVAVETAPAQAETIVSADNEQSIVADTVPVQPVTPEKTGSTDGTNGFAIAGFVCSFFVPILGIIFGAIGMAKSKKMSGKGLGFSIAALAISITFMVINMLTCGSVFAELLEEILYFEDYYDNPYYY